MFIHHKFLKKFKASNQDGGIGKHSTRLLPQPHQNYNQTTLQPSFRTARNQAEWKFYNYGIKEETTSRLAGEAEMLYGLVPHQHVLGKNQEEYLR